MLVTPLEEATPGPWQACAGMILLPRWPLAYLAIERSMHHMPVSGCAKLKLGAVSDAMRG